MHYFINLSLFLIGSFIVLGLKIWRAEKKLAQINGGTELFFNDGRTHIDGVVEQERLNTAGN